MVNMLNMLKQATSVQKQLKQVQKELARETVECESRDGTVKAVARGDLTIESIRIDPAGLASPDPGELEQRILFAVNGALDSAKKMAGREMSKLTGGLGLGL